MLLAAVATASGLIASISAVSLMLALAFDAIVLAVFGAMKRQSNPMIVTIAAVAIAAVFAFECLYLSRWLAPLTDTEH